ncbi:MAG: nucleotidyltransferase family protein [Nitrososphaerales archaeon]
MLKQAVILAGGLGLRLRPITENSPKVMVNLGERSLAEWQISWLSNYGLEKLIFAVGYKWEKIKDFFSDNYKGISIQYSVEEEPLGTGGAIKKALKFCEEDSVMILNGDVLTDMNPLEMLDWHRRLEALATIMIVPFVSPYGIVEVSPRGKVKRFVEKPIIPNVYINGGVYILNHDIIKYLPDKGDVEKETFPLLSEKGLLAAFPHEGFWRSIDTKKDLDALEKEIQELRKRLHFE